MMQLYTSSSICFVANSENALEKAASDGTVLQYFQPKSLHKIGFLLNFSIRIFVVENRKLISSGTHEKSFPDLASDVTIHTNEMRYTLVTRWADNFQYPQKLIHFSCYFANFFFHYWKKITFSCIV